MSEIIPASHADLLASTALAHVATFGLAGEPGDEWQVVVIRPEQTTCMSWWLAAGRAQFMERRFV